MRLIPSLPEVGPSAVLDDRERCGIRQPAGELAEGGGQLAGTGGETGEDDVELVPEPATPRRLGERRSAKALGRGIVKEGGGPQAHFAGMLGEPVRKR